MRKFMGPRNNGGTQMYMLPLKIYDVIHILLLDRYTGLGFLGLAAANFCSSSFLLLLVVDSVSSLSSWQDSMVAFRSSRSGARFGFPIVSEIDKDNK